eukprot:PhF_6_TR22302/c0_g1_i1/m.31560
MMFEYVATKQDRRWDPKLLVYNAVGLMDNHSSDLLKPYHDIARGNDHDFKSELYAILKDLSKHGVLKWTQELMIPSVNVGLMKGSHVIPFYVMKVMLNMFPSYDSGYLSDVLQMCTDNYNLEIFYQNLNIHTLIPPAALANHGQSFQARGYTVKALAGDLYFASTIQAGRKRQPPSIASLAYYALRSLVAEVISQKMVDWAVRVDKVWREEYEWTTEIKESAERDVDSLVNQQVSIRNTTSTAKKPPTTEKLVWKAESYEKSRFPLWFAT